MSWIPDEFLQIFTQNGLLGVIHTILAMDLAILLPGKATELEQTLEHAMTAYKKQTEAEVEERIRAKKQNALERARSEAQKGDELPPQVPQLESGVLGKDTDRNAEVTKPPMAIQLYPMSVSETDRKSSCSQRKRNNKHQGLQTYQSSPNCATYIKDEDFSVLPQDKVHIKDNELKGSELKDTELEANGLEANSEVRIYPDDKEALLNHYEAMHPEESLRMSEMTSQSFPAHFSHFAGEFKSTKGLLHPGNVKGQIERTEIQNNMLGEMIDQHEHGQNAGEVFPLNQNEEQGCITSNYPGEQQAVEMEEQQQGEISSQGSNDGLENNGDAESERPLDGRATYVISYNVAPEPGVPMLEDTGHLPWEPEPEPDSDQNGEGETLDPSSPTASPLSHQVCGEDHDQFDYWALDTNTIVNFKLAMDELVELNSWVACCGTDKDEVGLTERSSATTEPEEEGLQELDQVSDPVQRLPVEENSEFSLQEIYHANYPVQSIPSDSHTDIYRQTEEESWISCETTFITFDKCPQNDESNSHISLSPSEIVHLHQSDQTPAFSSRSSSQSIETSRTYVIECPQDEYLNRPHISPWSRTVTLSNRAESMLNPEDGHVRPLYSTSPRPTQLDSNESHSDTSMTAVHPVIDRDELSSSLSYTSAASDASIQLPDSDDEAINDGLKSALHTWRKSLSFSPRDSRLISPGSTKRTTGRLPRFHSAPSVSRPKLTQVTKVPSLPPIFESVVVLGSPNQPVQEKGMATHKSCSFPSVNTSARQYSATTPCSFQTNILPKSHTKSSVKVKSAQTPNSSRGSNDQEGRLTLDDRVIGKPPPSPSPSKLSRRSSSQTGSRPNSRHT